MESNAAMVGVWPVRIAWALLPLTLAPAFGSALDDTSLAVQRTATIAAWALWAAVLVATLVPRTLSLTVLRTAVPVVIGATGWAVVDAVGDDVAGLAEVVAACWVALLVVAAFAPTTGEAFVDGSSYGDERRMPLRVPPALLLGPLPLAWLVTCGPPVAAALLLATEQWIAGGLIGAAALVLVPSGARALHGLARRWVVFVPAGVVLHDPMTLAEPVLFPRPAVRRFGPAPADSTALDLSRNALGLALQIDVDPPQVVGVVRAPRHADPVEPVEASSVLFTPTRPGAVLHAAADRRIAVG